MIKEVLRFPGRSGDDDKKSKPEAALVGPNGTPVKAPLGPRVLLVGRAGSGKDTAADQIMLGFSRVEMQQVFGLPGLQPVRVFRQLSSTGCDPVVQIALAEPIKRAISSAFDIPPAALYDRERKDKPGVPGSDIHSPRDLCVALGMGMREKLFADVWLDLLLYRHRRLEDHSPDTMSIVSDVRMPNEFYKLRAAWQGRVLCIGLHGRGDGVDNEAEDAIDELVDKCDVQIYNGPDVSLEDFGRKVREAVLHWFPGLAGLLTVELDRPPKD